MSTSMFAIKWQNKSKNIYELTIYESYLDNNLESIFCEDILDTKNVVLDMLDFELQLEKSLLNDFAKGLCRSEIITELNSNSSNSIKEDLNRFNINISGKEKKISDYIIREAVITDAHFDDYSDEINESDIYSPIRPWVKIDVEFTDNPWLYNMEHKLNQEWGDTVWYPFQW